MTGLDFFFEMKITNIYISKQVDWSKTGKEKTEIK